MRYFDKCHCLVLDSIIASSAYENACIRMFVVFWIGYFVRFFNADRGKYVISFFKILFKVIKFHLFLLKSRWLKFPWALFKKKKNLDGHKMQLQCMWISGDFIELVFQRVSYVISSTRNNCSIFFSHQNMLCLFFHYMLNIESDLYGNISQDPSFPYGILKL